MTLLIGREKPTRAFFRSLLEAEGDDYPECNTLSLRGWLPDRDLDLADGTRADGRTRRLWLWPSARRPWLRPPARCLWLWFPASPLWLWPSARNLSPTRQLWPVAGPLWRAGSPLPADPVCRAAALSGHGRKAADNQRPADQPG